MVLNLVWSLRNATLPTSYNRPQLDNRWDPQSLPIPTVIMSSHEVSDSSRFRSAAILTLTMVGLLWLVYLGALIFDFGITQYGIYPRRISGLTGIVFAPIIHGSFAHLVSNSLPIILLGTALMYGYPRSAWPVLGFIYVGTGLGVWLIARDAYHIGASGLTTGMLFFVFIIGLLRRDPRAIVLSMLVFFLYGSMVWGVFPSERGVSFESHLCGAVMGVILAFVFRNTDPKLQKKRYSWEGESLEDSDISEPDSNPDNSRRYH